MTPATRDLVLLVTAAVGVLVFARYYVLAVLDADRPLARAAAVAFFVSAVAAIFLARSLV